MEMNEKTKKLFKGISKEKINEFENEYRSMCLSRIQKYVFEKITKYRR